MAMPTIEEIVGVTNYWLAHRLGREAASYYQGARSSSRVFGTSAYGRPRSPLVLNEIQAVCIGDDPR